MKVNNQVHRRCKGLDGGLGTQWQKNRKWESDYDCSRKGPLLPLIRSKMEFSWPVRQAVK